MNVSKGTVNNAIDSRKAPTGIIGAMKGNRHGLPNRIFAYSPLLLTFAIVAGSAQLVKADYAVVLGINKYSDPDGCPDLNGCVNDARSMGDILKNKYNFKVTPVIGGDATHFGIVDALETAAKECNPDERFVFFMSSHGTNYHHHAALCPYDTTEDDKNLLSSEELRKLVKAIPASSHTIILDSCFSGGMAKETEYGFTEEGETRVSKFVELGQGDEQQISDSSDSDDVSFNFDEPQISQSDGSATWSGKEQSICYVVATAPGEESWDVGTGKSAHGEFTRNLERYLDGSPTRWGQIMTKVKSHVRWEHPQLTPGFDGIPHFGYVTLDHSEPSQSEDEGNVTSEDFSAKELPHVGEISPAVLSIEAKDDQDNDASARLRLHQRIGLTVTPHRNGFLVALNVDPNGKKKFLHSGSQDLIEVSSGQDVRFPGNESPNNNGEAQFLTADVPGREQVTFYLFSSRRAAVAFQQAIRRGTNCRGLGKVWSREIHYTVSRHTRND